MENVKCSQKSKKVGEVGMNICNDNRFELIERYKKQLVESTNIESSSDEMAVIDNILLRFWQMGWLKEQEPDVIDLINKVIEEAIYHGGDPGGPYFCNEKRLEEAVRELSEALECSYEWDEEKQHPQFIRLKQ